MNNEMIDFSKVVLREEEQKYLDILKEPNIILVLQPQQSQYLLSLGFISQSPRFSDNQHFVLAENGERYLKYLNDEKCKFEETERKQQRCFNRENHREWIGIILSTAVAVVSLFISWLALTKQQ